jgi:hypothetical protein
MRCLYQGIKVFRFLSFGVMRFLGIKVSNFEVLRFLSLKESKFSGFGDLRFLGINVSGFEVSKFPGI